MNVDRGLRWGVLGATVALATATLAILPGITGQGDEQIDLGTPTDVDDSAIPEDGNPHWR